MTGSASDPPEWPPHTRTMPRREALSSRVRDTSDPFQIVIVRDKWQTGFDAPSLHTIRVDKPMRGHALLQAIARVNRVFKDKPGGLVVDYLGPTHQPKAALRNHSDNGGAVMTTLDQGQAVAVMLEKREVCCQLIHELDRSAGTTCTPAERLALMAAALECILAQEDGVHRCARSVRELSQAFALSVPSDEAMRIVDDVALF